MIHFCKLGKYASNVQLSEFAIPFGGLQGLHDKFTTLPQAMKKYGYATHMIGNLILLLFLFQIIF